MLSGRDSFMPVTLLNLDDAVTTALLLTAAFLPLGSSHVLACPIHMRSVRSRAPD